MNRRNLLRIGTATGLGMIAAAAVGAEDASPAGHITHPMPAGHEHQSSKYGGLIAAASNCVTTGDVCLSHCLTMLGQGDKDLADCARTVRETIAACTALRELAAAESPHLRDMAKVVSGICADCEAECKKHDKHAVCRDCAKACRECKDACDKASAAA